MNTDRMFFHLKRHAAWAAGVSFVIVMAGMCGWGAIELLWDTSGPAASALALVCGVFGVAMSRALIDWRREW